MSDTYVDVGYDSTQIGMGQKAAVLVVDWQLAFTDPRFELGGLARLHAARDNTAAFLKVARAAGTPIAACYTAYCSQKDMPLWKVAAVRREFFYGHECTEMDPKIHDPSDFTYCKNAPSMFFQTPLIAWLVKQNVDTVFVTGCTTSGCVRATIVDAFSYGFRVQVLADCCGDAEEGPHNDTLRDVGRRYADVTDRATAEAWIRSSARQNR
ncbi:MAG: isochorismatase family protein [Gammaproteobacteria bacterium]|nr:isochorismatase family protein [Gammaproteobacteria bacterium]